MASSETSRKTVPPGTRLGRYEVVTEIASGGMATVYLARSLGAAGFTRLVAMKVMHPHIASDEDFIAMFMDEARLAARIRHPNVVPTIDLENGDDGLFLVMEFIEGDGLLGLLRTTLRAGRKVPPPIALRIILDTLAGLHAAHELKGDQGEPLRLVHRDISPHNILVGADGITRITDFGIARAEERLSVTRDGQIKGKLAYMAPEQTSGQPVDRRADIFATAVVLWECLASKRLFHGANDGEVLRNLLVHPIPRLRSVVPEMPEAVDEVCARALARDPEERFSSAATFADALEEAGGSLGVASARAVGRWVREVSGARIDALEQAVRATLGDTNPSAVRPAVRARQMTDPERTVAKVEAPIVPMEAPPDTSQKPVVLPVAPPPRSKAPRALVMVGGVLLLLLLGSGSALAVWRFTSNRADGPARATAPVVRPAPSLIPPPPLSVAALPAPPEPALTPPPPPEAALAPPPVAALAPTGRAPRVVPRRPGQGRPVSAPGASSPPPPRPEGGFNPEAM